MGKKYWKILLLLGLMIFIIGCGKKENSAEPAKPDSRGTAEKEVVSTEAPETPDAEKEEVVSMETQEAEKKAAVGKKADTPTPAEKEEPSPAADPTEEKLNGMSLEEKAAQLFVVLPEDLAEGVDCVVAAGEMTRAAINEIPVGGVIYMGPNLESADQVRTMLANTQQYSRERIGLPMFLCVDEEGGKVARVASSGNFDVPVFDNMQTVGERGDTGEAYQIGRAIGGYLSDLGFNVDFAPVADVLTNPDNQVIGIRSFGSDCSLVSDMALAVYQGLSSQGVLGVYKHFPGHGSTAGDTHEGYAFSDKSLEELMQCEFVPFIDGIKNGISFIMAAHIALPNVTGGETPASLSPEIITSILREQLGFDGLVITDAMNMGAVVQQYSSGEAAVKALQAGADVILMPENFREAYQAVLDAVRDGTLTQERIDQSVRRVIRAKNTLD